VLVQKPGQQGQIIVISLIRKRDEISCVFTTILSKLKLILDPAEARANV